MTIIISAFPASGKSYLYNNDTQLKIADSDSSKFSWILDSNGNSTGVRNPDFIKDYSSHILALIGNVDVIMVSSHQDVRDMLTNLNLKWVSVLPNYSLKEEWVERCKNRGSSEAFCNLISNDWDSWVFKEKGNILVKGATLEVELNSGEYLSDYLDKLLNDVSINNTHKQ